MKKDIINGTLLALFVFGALLIYDKFKEARKIESPSAEPASQAETPETLTVSALLRDNNFMQVASALKTDNDSPAIESLAEELPILREELKAKDLPVEVPKNLTANKSGVDFVLSCEADQEEYVARYFYVFIETEKEFSLPQHYVNNRDNYLHSIGDRHFDTVLRFYYRSIYEDQSAWGLNFRRLDATADEYTLSYATAFPDANSSNNAEVSINRKTGRARVETSMKFPTEPEPSVFNDSYPCSKLSREEAQLVTQFYTGVALHDALQQWRKTEDEFSDKREQPTQF